MINSIYLFAIKIVAVLLTFTEMIPFIPKKYEPIEPENGNIGIISSLGYASRVCPLNNGTLIGGYEKDGTIRTATSDDNGKTWNNDTLAVGFDGLICANVNFYETKDMLCLAYRAIGTKEDGSFYGSLRMSISPDNGKTWSFHSIIAENTETDGSFKGIWEPCLGLIGDELVCVYANDSTSVTSKQNIESLTWDGENWSSRRILSNGEEHNSRDGMPVWCQLKDGTYAMVIESTKYRKQDKPFVIQIMYSTDGYNYGKPYDVYISEGEGSKAAAPGICELSDGRIVISFQTDEDKETKGDNVSVSKIITSKKVNKKPKSVFDFSESCKVFPDEYDAYSIWGGICATDNEIIYSAGTPFGAAYNIVPYSEF